MTTLTPPKTTGKGILGNPLKSELIGAKPCSDYNFFGLAETYTEMTEGFKVRRVRLKLTCLGKDGQEQRAGYCLALK